MRLMTALGRGIPRRLRRWSRLCKILRNNSRKTSSSSKCSRSHCRLIPSSCDGIDEKKKKNTLLENGG